MKMIKTDIVVGVPYIVLSWFITLFINGFVNEGSILYLFKGGVSSDAMLIAQIVMWLIPKLLMSYYLANRLFRNYKYTFAYYFVRSRDSLIWMKRIFIQIIISTCILTFMKLCMAMMIEVSSIYFVMSIIEIFYILFIMIIIFIILLITNNEKLSMLVMLVVIACNFKLFLSGNIELVKLVFMYDYPMMIALIYALFCMVGVALIYLILKKKEFYY